MPNCVKKLYSNIRNYKKNYHNLFYILHCEQNKETNNLKIKKVNH